MAKKLKTAWVLELDDTFGRYVLGIFERLETCEEYVQARETEYDIINRSDKRIYRNGNGVRYIATVYKVRS